MKKTFEKKKNSKMLRFREEFIGLRKKKKVIHVF